MPGSIRKAQIRNRIWERMTRMGVALLPGAFGRTPAFRGQEQGTERLRQLEIWTRATRVLVLDDPALRGVREAALSDGKVLVVPDLSGGESGWMREIDPAGLDGAQVGRLSNSRCLRGQETTRVDLMVIGAVGVDRRGNRIGKGIGGADLIYALGRDRGFLAAETPVAVLIHPLQFFQEPTDREPRDLPIDYIVTPEEVIHVSAVKMRPKGLHVSMITPRRLKAFPGLRVILKREGIVLPQPKGPQPLGS